MVQASFNGTFRKNFALVGSTYDNERYFINAKPLAVGVMYVRVGLDSNDDWQPPRKTNRRS